MPVNAPPTGAWHADVMESVVELDVRGLEPPQPLVRILEALGSLTPGTVLKARTDRNPIHLHAVLKERGFNGQTQLVPGEGFLTEIRHAA